MTAPARAARAARQLGYLCLLWLSFLWQVNSGVFQLPLYAGTPPLALLQQVARRGQEVLEAALSKKQLKRMDLRCVRVLRRLWHVPCTKASVYKSNDIYPAWNKHAHGSWAKPQRAPLKTNDHALTGPLEVTFGLIHYPPVS